jgi:iron complex outermembrane receptor protein
MSFREQQGEECYSVHIGASVDVPGNCKLKAFTTVDVSAVYKIGDQTEVFGSIANLFGKKPPQDYMTYGAIGYNPLDYSGAIGRAFRIGVKHKFR